MKRRHIAILSAGLAICGITAGVFAGRLHGNPVAPPAQAQGSLTSQFGITGLDDEIFAENGISLSSPTVQPGVGKDAAEATAQGFVPESTAVTAVFADIKSTSVRNGMPGVGHCWIVIVKTSAPQIPAGLHHLGTPYPATGNNMEIVVVDGHTGKVLLGWRSAAMPVLK